MSQRAKEVTQDPNEKLSYAIDWEDQLVSGDTIASSVWTYDGLTSSGAEGLATPIATSKKVTGGTTGTDYVLENTVTTTPGGDILQAHILIRVRG